MAEHPRGLTVRARVTALATVLALVVLVAAGVGVSARHEDLLVENLEEALEVGADDLAATIASGRSPAPVAGFGDDDAAFQVLDPDGVVLAASANIAGADALAAAPNGDDVLRTVDGLPHDDARFLVLSRRVEGRDGPVVLHVAATLDDVEESTSALRRTMVAAVPVVVAVLAGAVWFVVGRALRPVERIRAEVADISGADLSRRVPVPLGDDEVARLARTMNEMLERVESAVDRQQRLVADASHELRSPLTRMRTELEVDRAHPEQADPAATRESVLEEVVGLQRTVEDLLHLARLDRGAPAGPTEAVAFDELVAHAAADLRAASGRTVEVDLAPVLVEGRPEALRRLVANLLDNAGRHARQSIGVSLVGVDGTAVLSVDDDGPGIPPPDRERVFERFTRLDAARAGATGGTGLGLAIVREVAAQHGGSVTIDDAPTGGARFVVTLPVRG